MGHQMKFSKALLRGSHIPWTSTAHCTDRVPMDDVPSALLRFLFSLLEPELSWFSKCKIWNPGGGSLRPTTAWGVGRGDKRVLIIMWRPHSSFLTVLTSAVVV